MDPRTTGRGILGRITIDGADLVVATQYTVANGNIRALCGNHAANRELLLLAFVQQAVHAARTHGHGNPAELLDAAAAKLRAEGHDRIPEAGLILPR
jgi:hypothetical protein